jgi:dTMP kinase
MNGHLVAVSGVDGSGKSTLLRGLAAALSDRGHVVTSLAALKPAAPVPLTWLSEITSPVPALRDQAELWTAGYFALVFQHNLACRVEPALARGEWVLADRWSLDHLANQTALDVDVTPWLPSLHTARRPDAHFLIDVPPETAGERIARRGGPAGVGTGKRFLGRCADLMLSAAASPGFAPVRVLDGTLPEPAVLAAALAFLDTEADR